MCHSPLECLHRLKIALSMLHVESSIASFLMFIYSLIIDLVLLVGGTFPMLLNLNNFTLSCNLMGPSNLAVLFNFSLIYGRSPGYGVSLVAETTTGCLLSVDVTVSYPSVDEMNEESEKPELMSPEDLGVQAASMLLEEVAQGGVVDSTHQV